MNMEQTEGIKTIKVITLRRGLMDMGVGESRYVDPETTPYHVRKECSTLKSEGYEFVTSTRSGRMLVTRIN